MQKILRWWCQHWSLFKFPWWSWLVLAWPNRYTRKRCINLFCCPVFLQSSIHWLWIATVAIQSTVFQTHQISNESCARCSLGVFECGFHGPQFMAIANNFLSLSGNSQLIDHLIDFSRYQIVHTIFPAYDALYRQIHKGAGAGEDEGNMACFGTESLIWLHSCFWSVEVCLSPTWAKLSAWWKNHIFLTALFQQFLFVICETFFSGL